MTLDRRLGDLPQAPLDAADVAIIGLPDDRGIVANNGRPGARQAPEAIRRYLYKTTPGPKGAIEKLKWIDLGDVDPGDSIEAMHEAGAEMCRTALSAGAAVIALGGGHDLAHCDLSALMDRTGGPVGVVNIDAHLDLREYDQGINSGTAFRRLIDRGLEPGSLIEFGIQAHSNASGYLDYAAEKGVEVYPWEHVRDDPVGHLQNIFGQLAERTSAIGVSFDIDCVAGMAGCSAPSPIGLTPQQALDIARLSANCARSFGIFEVSPPLDVADQTSRLAALMVWTILYGRSLKAP